MTDKVLAGSSLQFVGKRLSHQTTEDRKHFVIDVTSKL